MKSVLISIQPRWCELIAQGNKTVEVRKTRPKIETPFKVYIYETQGRTETPFVDEEGHYIFKGRGQVIGEFVCDSITEFENSIFDEALPKTVALSCVNMYDLLVYLGKQDYGYGWHISDLVIYDKPRELSEFKTICRNAYCQDDWGKPTWFCKDGYSSCAVIDKEKEFPYNEECIYFDCPSVGGESCEYEDYAYCNCDGLKPITRPFQSWGYVESEEHDGT